MNSTDDIQPASQNGTEPAEPVAPRQRPYAALQFRDYRIWWASSFVSLVGSQMSALASSWQVYALTHNALMLGATGLFSLVPTLLLSLYGGVVADAVDRRKLLLGSQTMLLLASAALAALTFTGYISVWWIYGIASLRGAAMAFNNPARTAMIANLVPRAYLPGAISLGTTNMQIATIVGPSLAGVIIGAFHGVSGGIGIAVVYTTDAVSFTAVLIALIVMRTPLSSGPAQPISLGAAAEGLRYVFRSPILKSTMLLDFAATFFGASESLMPIFATQRFHAGPYGLGYLMAAPSVGAAIVAILFSTRAHVHRQGLAILVGIGCYGLSWMVFGATTSFWIGWLALAGTGASDMVSTIMRQTISQLVTPDELRGRMSSVRMIFFMGGPRLGEFESGAVAHFLSAPIAAMAGGAGVLAVAAAVSAGVPSLRKYESTQHHEA